MLVAFRRSLRTRAGRSAALCILAVQCVPLLPQPAYAFKPRTHLWVAQQVLNDVLLDGRVTLAGREYTVPANRVEALRRNPDAYRMGHIGPDAHPDLLVGQSVIHPGDPWPVDSWLRHVVTQAGGGTGSDVAYAFGFLGHAAGDIWAHSYVNQYAGSSFDLTQDGTDGEIRHIALEGYIDNHAPDIVDAQGAALGAPERIFDGPHEFLRDEFILSASAAAQYNRRPAMAAHLIAMRQFGLTLADFRKLVEDLSVAPAELERAIRQASLDAVIAANQHLGPLNQARQSLRLAREALAAHENAIAVARNLAITRRLAAVEAAAAVRNAEQLERRLIAEKSRLENSAIDLASRIEREPDRIAQEVCKKVKKWLGPFSFIFETVCNTIQVVNQVKEDLRGERNRLLRRISDLNRDILNAASEARAAAARHAIAVAAEQAAVQDLLVLEANTAANDALQSAVAEGLRTVERLEAEQTRLERLAREAEAKLGTLTDLQHSLLTGAISLRIGKWQSDVNRAVLAYEDANTQVMRALVGPGDPLDPLTQWALCWGPVFMSVPSEVPVVACGAMDIVRNGLQELRDTRAEIADRAGDLGWLIDPGHKMEQMIEKRVLPDLVRAERAILTRVAGPDISALIVMMHEPVDASILNDHFSVDRNRQGILLIPDMAARADADMALTGGRFAPTRFAPAANAVTLSKLALLDAAGMRQLLRDLGIAPAEAEGVREPFNVLFSTARSIDGNHQWIGGPAPEFPRRRGRGPGVGERRFGMNGPGEPGTLVWLFAEQHRRDRAFEKLFVGPIAPALEQASALGFSELLPRDHPRGREGEPFVSFSRRRCYVVRMCDTWEPRP